MTARRAFALLLLFPFTLQGGAAATPDATLAGTVTDQAGRPLADAEVRLDRIPGGERVVTDARGGFRLTGLCAGCDVTLRATRSGFAQGRWTVSLPRQGGTLPALRLVLRPGRTADGLVVDESGRPASGARVELVQEDQETAGLSRGEAGPFQAATGPDGRFEIPDLPAGRFTVGIARPGRPLLKAKSLWISGQPGRTDAGRLETGAGRTIAGRALDPEGRPLAGVQVWVVPKHDSVLEATWDRQIEAGPQAVTGADGRFEILHVDAEESLLVCRTGYDSAALSSSGDVTLDPRIVEPRSSIAGRVMTASGEPVAGAAISLPAYFFCGGTGGRRFSPCKIETEPEPPDPVTGPDGRFILELRGSGVTAVQTRPPGFLEASQDGVEFGPGRHPFVELVVQPGAVVTGRVFSANGRPAAGVEVAADDVQATVTGADGAFRIEGVEPGRRSLWASHRELGEAGRRLEVAPGETRQDLTLDGRGVREARGRVLGPGGDPLPGARVRLACPRCPSRTAWSAGDGSFVLADVPESAEVRAELAGFSPGQVPLPQGRSSVDGVEIRLEKGIVLTGRILDLELPHERQILDSFWKRGMMLASVTARRAGEEPRSGSVDRDGTYRISDLGPGEWEVTASVLRRRQSEGIVLEAGMEEAALDIRLPSAYEVQGRIVDEQGRPVRGHLQIFETRDGRVPADAPAPASTDSREDGAFEIWLQEGVYLLRASAPNLAPGTAMIHVDGPLLREIRLEKGAVLRGRLLGILPDGSTDVLAPNNLRADIAPDGTFRLTGLGPGTWNLEATHQEPDGARRTAHFSVEIAPGALEAVRDVDFAAGDFVLSGRLLSGNEEPVSAFLRLVRTDGVEIQPSGWVSPDGDFRVPRLAPGRYRLEVTDYSGHNVLTQEVEIDGDREVEIEMSQEAEP